MFVTTVVWEYAHICEKCKLPLTYSQVLKLPVAIKERGSLNDLCASFNPITAMTTTTTTTKEMLMHKVAIHELQFYQTLRAYKITTINNNRTKKFLIAFDIIIPSYLL